MPLGTPCVNRPFGPCTSTAPSSTLIVTPLGTTLGFFPIRDIFYGPCRLRASAFVRIRPGAWSLEPDARHLPDIAKHFPADAGLDRFTTGHHPARGRQDAGAESGQ